MIAYTKDNLKYTGGQENQTWVITIQSTIHPLIIEWYAWGTYIKRIQANTLQEFIKSPKTLYVSYKIANR